MANWRTSCFSSRGQAISQHFLTWDPYVLFTLLSSHACKVPTGEAWGRACGCGSGECGANDEFGAGCCKQPPTCYPHNMQGSRDMDLWCANQVSPTKAGTHWQTGGKSFRRACECETSGQMQLAQSSAAWCGPNGRNQELWVQASVEKPIRTSCGGGSDRWIVHNCGVGSELPDEQEKCQCSAAWLIEGGLLWLMIWGGIWCVFCADGN